VLVSPILSRNFVKKEHRLINSDQTFNNNSTIYLIKGFPDNLKNKLIEVRTYQDCSLGFSWATKKLEVIEFNTYEKLVA
jgi:hypothetical protein